MVAEIILPYSSEDASHSGQNIGISGHFCQEHLVPLESLLCIALSVRIQRSAKSVDEDAKLHKADSEPPVRGGGVRVAGVRVAAYGGDVCA